MATRHIKPRGMQEPGGIREQEAAIHISNLMLIDPRSEKPTKVGFRVLDDGGRWRRESDGRSDRNMMVGSSPTMTHEDRADARNDV